MNYNIVMSDLVYLVDSVNNIDNQNNLYYFDFKYDKWEKCFKIKSYPYYLNEYKFENSNETFITCNDSYRLTENLEYVLSNEEMYKEKEWRDKVVKDNEELDMYSDGEWHKMKVGWIKNDIIRDVLHLIPRRRNSDNDKLCCYFYKESKKLAKSCTQTPIISIEQLKEEKEQDERAKKYREYRNSKIKEIEKSLKLFKIKDEYHSLYAPSIKEKFFYDTLPYYQSLKLNNDKKLLSKEDFLSNAKITYEEYLLCDNHTKLLGKLVKDNNNKTADMVSIEDEYTDIKKCYQPLKTDYDAYCNIKIYNATYANLKCDYKKIDCDIIDSIDDKKIFGFKDITEKNPIFNSTLSNTIAIETDGDKITFDGILMDIIPRHILKCAQLFTVIHFPSKNFVLLANTFCSSTMQYPYERIEETINPSYKLNII